MKEKFSASFVLMAVTFTVCLITSNLFASKLFCLFGRFTLSGAVILFPISYILNDCLSEVYGYRKTRFVIWIAFALNLFIVLISQLVIILPGAPFWDGDEGFRQVFGAAPRSTIASLLAFLVGSTVNALVMSRMKVSDNGKRFGLRAIISSLAGESLDSLIFVPIVFWSFGIRTILITMACQITAKVAYEIIILPITTMVVGKVKQIEGIDTFDENISYNPFRINDI